jgi:peroxiredoxin
MQKPPPVRLAVLLAILAGSLVAWVYREPIRDRIRHERMDTEAMQGEVAPELPELPTLDGRPVTLAALRGQVVLLHFWTFACSNCEHMQPHYRDWNARYRAAGLSIVGVHSPETLREQDLYQLRRYVEREHIDWPTVIDRDFEAWNRFHVQAWPTVVLIDRRGQIRAVHIGDHLTDRIEHDIQRLVR